MRLINKDALLFDIKGLRDSRMKYIDEISEYMQGLKDAIKAIENAPEIIGSKTDLLPKVSEDNNPEYHNIIGVDSDTSYGNQQRTVMGKSSIIRDIRKENLCSFDRSPLEGRQDATPTYQTPPPLTPYPLTEKEIKQLGL